MENKYITIRTKALSEIINKSAEPQQKHPNIMLSDLFYELLKEDFKNLRVKLKSDSEFFKNISDQAKKLSWGEWHHQDKNGSITITIKNCPFRKNPTSDENTINFYGPVHGVLRACMAAIKPHVEHCIELYENQNEITYNYLK